MKINSKIISKTRTWNYKSTPKITSISRVLSYKSTQKSYVKNRNCKLQIKSKINSITRIPLSAMALVSV